MRIAIFIPGFQRDASDWCIPAFTNLAKEIAKQADVHVFALRHPPKRRSYQVGAVRVRTVGAGSFGSLRLPGLSLVKLWLDLLRSFDRVQRKQPFDAVLGFWATESGALACVAGKRWGLPVLVHLAGGELVRFDNIDYGNWRHGLAGALVDMSLQNADILSVPSSHMRTLITRRHPPAVTQTMFWPLGVDTTFFAPIALTTQNPPDPFTFVAVASLLPVKGLDLLIEAATQLRVSDPGGNFRVLIVGDGPHKHRLLDKITVLNLEGYVVLVGEIFHSDLPATFASAHCFVLTSWHEAQCMALLEAAATGLPWIATSTGAAVDLAQSTQPSGILLANRSPGTLAHAMSTMMNLTYEERTEMGKAAREQVLAAYNLRKQTSSLVSRLSALTASKQPRRMKVNSPKSVTLDVITLMIDLATFSLAHLR